MYVQLTLEPPGFELNGFTYTWIFFFFLSKFTQYYTQTLRLVEFVADPRTNHLQIPKNNCICIWKTKQAFFVSFMMENVFLKDLRIISLKGKHQGESTPNCPFLQVGRSLTSLNILLQVAKLPHYKISLFLFWTRPIS